MELNSQLKIIVLSYSFWSLEMQYLPLCHRIMQMSARQVLMLKHELGYTNTCDTRITCTNPTPPCYKTEKDTGIVSLSQWQFSKNNKLNYSCCTSHPVSRRRTNEGARRIIHFVDGASDCFHMYVFPRAKRPDRNMYRLAEEISALLRHKVCVLKEQSRDL
jgi:hypothetical protein